MLGSAEARTEEMSSFGPSTEAKTEWNERALIEVENLHMAASLSTSDSLSTTRAAWLS